MPAAGLPFLWSGAWPRRRLALGWVAGWGSFQYLELGAATSGYASLQCLGSACGWDGTTLGGIGELASFGHISRGHEEIGGVNGRSGAGSGHHFGREHWSGGHSLHSCEGRWGRRALGGEHLGSEEGRGGGLLTWLLTERGLAKHRRWGWSVGELWEGLLGLVWGHAASMYSGA